MINQDLTLYLFESLNSPGSLIVSNIHNANTHRCYMEYCGEWHLIHRSEGQMLEMIEGVDQCQKNFIELDATGANIFLNIEM